MLVELESLLAGILGRSDVSMVLWSLSVVYGVFRGRWSTRCLEMSERRVDGVELPVMDLEGLMMLERGIPAAVLDNVLSLQASSTEVLRLWHW
jgi:hypothetical protein